MDKKKQFFEWIRTKPVWFRVIWLILVFAAALALSLTSCSHSRVLFKGSGDLEYEYNGKYVEPSDDV